jgi:hypothetical protein
MLKAEWIFKRYLALFKPGVCGQRQRTFAAHVSFLGYSAWPCILHGHNQTGCSAYPYWPASLVLTLDGFGINTLDTTQQPTALYIVAGLSED